jgi:putative protease
MDDGRQVTGNRVPCLGKPGFSTPRSLLKPGQTELLAPARDLTGGKLAIDCGADAVYIGAARYGARAQAGNRLADIEALADYAHRYWARVYVTLNTLLHEHELPAAVRLAHDLHQAGADALIVQDTGLLESDLPPLPLVASTQMHNDRPAKVAFLEQVGFSRAILARELSLSQVRAIRAATEMELEYFVHGALCVCYSGQCTMSYAIGGRSGNRGECAQPCRRRYTLVDGAGHTRAEGHLLSLHDLNLSEHLGELLDAGVTSFKIEGRLKDDAYVKNVVSAYRRRLDQALAERGLSKSSSGQSALDLEPDLDKTFNRGYTTYYVHGGRQRPGAPDTPKMRGEPVGRVLAVGAPMEDRRSSPSLRIETAVELHNGDGLTFFDEGVLRGTYVNGVRGAAQEGETQITVADAAGIRVGTLLYRNHDHAFLADLDRARVERRIAVWFTVEESDEGLVLVVEDEEGNRAEAARAGADPARKPEAMRATLERQLARTGETIFRCAGIDVRWSQAWFLPVYAVNDLRRRALDALLEARAHNRPVAVGGAIRNEAPYPETALTYHGNVLNPRAEAFYRRHGVTEIEPAAESGLDLHGREVMRTRYCLRAQLGHCLQEPSGADLPGPLLLVDEEGHRFPLRFHCDRCEMSVFY